MNKYLPLALLALCLCGLMPSPAQAQTGGNQIHACYQKSSGQLRRVGDPIECRPSEVALSWNLKGEKGDAGEKGAKGEKGERGEKGNEGERGPRGPSFGDTVNESKLSITNCDTNIVATMPVTITEDSRIYVSSLAVFVPFESGATGASAFAVLTTQNGKQVLATTAPMIGSTPGGQATTLISNGVLQSNGAALVVAPGLYQLQMNVNPSGVCSPGQGSLANAAGVSTASLSYILLGNQP